jgi:hypothetical protein
MLRVTRPGTRKQWTEIQGPGPGTGSVVVSNGSTTYLYNRCAEGLRVIDLDRTATVRNWRMGAAVEMARRLNAEPGAAAVTSSGVSALPKVPLPKGTGADAGTVRSAAS